jgi:hypothetical protein
LEEKDIILDGDGDLLLRIALCQDSSIKVRRTAFQVWINLHGLGDEDGGDWLGQESLGTLRTILERCSDR